jgi:hypothetical protein
MVDKTNLEVNAWFDSSDIFNLLLGYNEVCLNLPLAVGLNKSLEILYLPNAPNPFQCIDIVF